MTISTNARRFGLATLTVVAAAFSLGAAPASPPALSAQHVDDFVLPDQNYLARQLSRLQDTRAVVLITCAAGDAQVREDAPAYMALKAAYAGKGVEFWMLDSKLGETRPTVQADAKAAGIDMPILFDYEQLVGEQLNVSRAAEVIVLDPRSWTVAYRGPVSGPAGEAWAGRALDGLTAGQKVAFIANPARGGAIALPERGQGARFDKIPH